MKHNAISKIIASLTKRDIEALQSIYSFRCLTQHQIYELHYKYSLRMKEQVTDNYCKKKISEFLNLNLIEKVIEGTNEGVFFLTPLGIEVIRYCLDLPVNIYDSKKKVVKRGYYRASELKIYPKNINHQIHLNQFVLDFKSSHPDLQFKYYDEKYVSNFSGIRPDGLITMLDADYFLEIDMASESKKQLLEKWENYRRFINSREYSFKERKIIVLFIVDNTARIEERINLVKYTIYERLLDVVDANFEIYVGDKNTILSLLDNHINTKKDQPLHEVLQILAQKHRLTVSLGEKIAQNFRNVEYGYYLRKTNGNNKIVIENGRVQEFVLDNYLFSPLSVIGKIAYLERNNALFKQKYNREILYIVVVSSEVEIYNDLKLFDLIAVNNVYFTTPSRLKRFPFSHALFQFDFLGNMHSFSNNGLTDRAFERNIGGF